MDARVEPREIELWEAVSRDPALQRRLVAASSGDEAMQVIRDSALDPQGAAALCREASPRWDGPPRVLRENAPPAQWLPVHLFEDEGGVKVEWHHFGFARLTEPFFEQSWARAAALPAQSLLRMQTPVDAFLEFRAGPPPDGFVFHMSRCGSTLVAQMLAELDEVTVVSEAPVSDTVLRLHRSGRLTAEHLRGAAAALTRFRHPDARRAVFKLDAWHTPCWRTLASVFPETPAIFLHRDPIEVLVSQERRPGMHVTPGQLPLSLYGFTGGDGIAGADHAAWAIAQIVNAGLEAVVRGFAEPVDFAELPDAILEKILPHFGIATDDAARERLVEAGLRYSKDPSRTYLPDAQAKRASASPELRARVEAFGLDRMHARLVETRNRPHGSLAQQKTSVRVGFRFD
ncbi:hypothetical protein [Citromicrobium bathyomarinum]|uniref:hypothetical protein n=1 Tax=Citromicrobium bathyomarinum TaxID=72174 RepID=UPI00315B24CD